MYSDIRLRPNHSRVRSVTGSMRYYVLGSAGAFSRSMLNGVSKRSQRSLFGAGKMTDIPCSAALSWDAPARGDWLDQKLLSAVQ